MTDAYYQVAAAFVTWAVKWMRDKQAEGNFAKCRVNFEFSSRNIANLAKLTPKFAGW